MRERKVHAFMFWLRKLGTTPDWHMLRVEKRHDWTASIITSNPARARMLRFYLMGRWGMGCGELFEKYCLL